MSGGLVCGLARASSLTIWDVSGVRGQSSVAKLAAGGKCRVVGGQWSRPLRQASARRARRVFLVSGLELKGRGRWVHRDDAGDWKI